MTNTCDLCQRAGSLGWMPPDIYDNKMTCMVVIASKIVCEHCSRELVGKFAKGAKQ